MVNVGNNVWNPLRLKRFIELMEKRAVAFDMAGGILSVFPWLRYIAPRASGYKLLLTLNEELNQLLRVNFSGKCAQHIFNYEPMMKIQIFKSINIFTHLTGNH